MIRTRWSGSARSSMGSAGLALLTALVLAACTSGDSSRAARSEPAPPAAVESAAAQEAPVQVAAPTAPAGLNCNDLTLTPAQTEGPYWTPNSPERASLLEPGMTGTRLVITGVVVTADCRPVAGAMLDFWQADEAGRYDNAGFRLRGHQFADQNGRYELETIVPGLYPGRTRHLHVKVQAPGGPVLTTQLYFPEEPGNARDGIFRPQVQLTDVQETADGVTAAFTFVLAG